MSAVSSPPPVGASTRFGIFLNNRGAVFLGDDYSLTSLVALAQRAEALGFDFVSVGDSVLAKPRFAPVPTLAAIAAVTERVELTTGILQPHLRPAVLLAQEWATLDVLSGGRTSLGVGLGTGPRELVDAELALAGLDRRRRARAFEDAIVALRLLWRGGPVDFTGTVTRLDGVDMGYAAAQPGGPRILVACGAFVPATAGFGPNDVFRADAAGTTIGPFDRVARLGDGWISGIAFPEEFAALFARVVEEGDKVGRDLAAPGFERRFNTFVHVGDDASVARHRGQEFLEAYHRLPMDDATIDRWLIAGAPDACATRIDALIDAGVTSFQFVLADRDQHAQLERLAGEVLPMVRRAPAAPEAMA
jgi:alkanesulfonate monooxygenase SsuD/methylene tetrahydromethanopterin reductase-like flavin-dependent oxidoreductase (luciferase family)